MKQQGRSTLNRHRREYLWIFAVGAVLFIAAYLIFSYRDIENAAEVTRETLSMLDRQVVRFEGYQSNDETKSLIRLLDKTSEVSQRLARPSKQNTEFLDQYAYEQRLDGIIVLDENRNIVLKSSGVPDPIWLQKDLLNGQNIQDIIDYPQKTFMTRTEWEGVQADMAAVARQGEEGGVVICYYTQSSVRNNVNDITFDVLLDGYNFELNGVGGISNGKTLVSTDEENAVLLQKLIRDLETARVKDRYCTMLHFWSQGQRWYASKATVGDRYTIYVAFPYSAVFRTRNMVMLSGAVIFVLFLLAYLLMQTRNDRENMEKIQKQYRTINAINRAFSTNFLIQLEKDRLEVIKEPPRLESKLLSYSTATEKLRAIAKMCLLKEEQDAFIAFTDPATIARRMENNDYLVMDYEDRWNRWYQSLLIPQRYDEDGQLVSVLFATRDISEEKAREHAYQEQLRRSVAEAEQASRVKGDFLRRMSHDVRTPINGIRGMVEIGNHYPDDLQKQAECRQKIWEASGFLLDLVNSVLDMNKLEAGEMGLQEKPFDLVQLARSSCDILEGQARSSGIELRRNPMEIRHRWLIGSPLHVRQILQNIGGNAIKYNRENGSVTFTTREIASDAETATYEFICEDTGIGMSPEFQKRAFEPFTQEEATARTQYQGSGLGLSICHQLAEQMGGSIRLESEQGVGTTVIITLQFRLDGQKQEEELLPKEPEKADGMKILLVEDNELNMEIAEFLLEREGAEVTKAWNGEEAVRAFEQSEPGSFDVILMDVMMPVMDGIEATKAIRAMPRPDAKSIPIFAMTANAFADDIARSRAAGMNEYIAKPLDAQKLRETLFKYKKK